MPLRAAIEGEDVPITVSYEADDGTAVDPDDTGTDAVPDASITITYEDDTAVVSGAAMNHIATGEFEYVWDTAADVTGTGTYTVDVSAEFGGETKITRSTIQLR